MNFYKHAVISYVISAGFDFYLTSDSLSDSTKVSGSADIDFFNSLLGNLGATYLKYSSSLISNGSTSQNRSI